MQRLVPGNPQLARLPQAKTVPALGMANFSCMHALSAWKPTTPKQPSRYPDGNPRPVALVGGKLRRHVAQCTERPGHDQPQPWNDGVPTPHRTSDGRTW